MRIKRRESLVMILERIRLVVLVVGSEEVEKLNVFFIFEGICYLKNFLVIYIFN